MAVPSTATNARNSAPRSSRAGSPADPAAGRGHAGIHRSRRTAADSSRSAIGRPAHTTASPPSSATLVPNSVVCGAISSVLATATRKPNAIRPRRPVGTVFGSVIMKNRKMRISGEVMMTRQ